MEELLPHPIGKHARPLECNAGAFTSWLDHSGDTLNWPPLKNIGSLAAYPFSPYLADGLGRKKTIFIGAVIMCIATVIQTASQSVGMFIGARFLIGFGLTFGGMLASFLCLPFTDCNLAAGAAPMLITEIAYPVYRGPPTSTYNSLWYSGAITTCTEC